MEMSTITPTNLSADTLFFFEQVHNFSLHSNLTNADSCSPPQLGIEHYIAIKVILGILYCLIFFTAVSGNLLVIYVVVSNKHMHTVTNFFITNLAISDLIVNLTSLWLTPLYTYLKRWVWGGAMCHIFPCAQGMSLYISTMTLTAIAIDRYIVILYPFAQRISIQLCLTVTISIWILSFMLVVPYTINMRHIHIETCGGKYLCLEAWINPEFKKVFGVVVMVLQFGIPFIIITFCYICIWMRLNNRANQSLAHSSGEMQRKRRMAKMLTSMVVIFALCSLPVNALNVLRDLKFTSKYFTLLFLLGHVCLMSATCWNPILYAWMNEYFQREFKTVLPCFQSVTRQWVRSLSLTRSINKSTAIGTRPIRNVGVVVDAESVAIIKDHKVNYIPPHKPTKARFDVGSDDNLTDEEKLTMNTGNHKTQGNEHIEEAANGKCSKTTNRRSVVKQASLDMMSKKKLGNKKFSIPCRLNLNGQCNPLISVNGFGSHKDVQLIHDEPEFNDDNEATPL